MMRGLSMLLCIALLATAARAQQVTVRSGEHDGFSRLVIGLPERVPWSLERLGNDRILRLDRAGLKFETDTVFDLIPRTRLVSLGQVDGNARSALRLTLDCGCTVEGFWYGASFLVLDIRDPAPDQSGEDQTAQSGLPPLTNLWKDLATARRSLAGALAAKRLGNHVLARPDTQGPRRSAAAKAIAGSRARLLRELGRAAAFGLVSPRRRPPQPGAAADHSVEKARRESEPSPPDTPVRPDALSLTARSGLDDSIVGTSFSDTVAPDGRLCLSATALAPGAWGGTGPFAAEIGALRLGLSAERDRTDPEVALTLARRYLHYGFGAEAAKTLALVDPDRREAAILGALATVMDTGHAPSGSILAGQLTCEGPAALWSALSYASLPENVAIDDDAVLRGLSALPRHLRDHLGPVLSRRFLASGRKPTADRIRRLLARDGQEEPPAARLAGAELDLAEGRQAQADAKLEEVVDSNGETAPEALLRRIEARLADGRGIPPEMAQLAGAFAQEHRDNPVGPDLAQAYVVATAAAGDFDTAFSELDRLVPDLPGDSERKVTTRLLALLAGNADDLTFLRHGAARRTDAPGLVSTVNNNVAKRLLDLGFTDLAAAYLAPDTEGPGRRDQQILRARASLQSGRPRQAEVDLLGFSGPDANRWRARARSMTGQHRAAQALYAGAEASGKAAREAFLAGDWEGARKINDPALRAIAEILSEPGATATQTGLLGRSRQSAERAGLIRTAITEVLRSPVE